MKKFKILIVIIVLVIIHLVNTDNNIQENQEIEVEVSQVEVREEFYYDKYYDLEIGDSLDDMISKVGKPDRIDTSEYGFSWYVYNKDLTKFNMVGIKDKKIVGFFSNSLDSCEASGITLLQNKEDVESLYKPIEFKLKNFVKYIVDSKGEYDIIDVDNKYITLFYDIHDNNKITSYLIIDKAQERELEGIYSQGNDQLKKSYELQTIDLINSERIKNNLEILTQSENAQKSSQNHSQDMMVNNFFNHINLNNKDPFDRMKSENIEYKIAGENIAAGQTNAIYAHEALMNSLGHRNNILGNYKYIGVGISFGGTYGIYYTQNFYK